MPTLQDALNSEIPLQLGFLPTDPRVVGYVNRAVQRLMVKGRWWGIFKRTIICAADGCIVWPREFANIETFQICSTNVPIRNLWFEFQDNVIPPTLTDGPGFDWKSLDRGVVPVGVQPPVPSQVRFYATNVSDAGVRILVQGLDQNGVIIRNLDPVTGSMVNGEYLTLVAPPLPVTSVSRFSQITAVQKGLTADRVLFVAVDPVTFAETTMATYQYDDIYPQFRRTFLTAFPRTQLTCPQITDDCPTPSTCTGANVYSVKAIVKLNFLPARVPTDWLLLENLPAISLMAQAVFKEDRGFDAAALTLEGKAVRELRNELKAMTGDVQTVNVQSQGSASLCRVFSGFI